MTDNTKREKDEAIEIIARGENTDGWVRDEDGLIWRNGEETITDLEVAECIREHTCAVCGYGYDPDIRTLRIGCFYELAEVSDKFIREGDYYYIKVCKGCRAVFMFEYLAAFIKSEGVKNREELDNSGNILAGAIKKA